MEFLNKQDGRALLPFVLRIAGVKAAINPDEALTRGQLEVAGTGVPVVLANIGAISSAIASTNTIATTNTTQSSSTTTGSIKTAGGIGVVKNATVGGSLVAQAAIVSKHTGVAINTTGAGTLAVVNSGVIAGLITSTSAAPVTVTLDSVANMITAFAAVGVTIGAGTLLEFYVDNSAGSSTVTVAVDAGTTLAVTTPVITGGATLTVSTANVVGNFGIYITTPTAGKLLRLY